MVITSRSAKFIAGVTASLSICCNIPRAAAQEFKPENREPSVSLSATQEKPHSLTPQQTKNIIIKAKHDDPKGFSWKRDCIAKSDAFMEVLKESTPDPNEALDFFAAISTKDQAKTLVSNTKGKRFNISGSETNPSVKLVPREASKDILANPALGMVLMSTSMPKCGKAWTAFSAWLAGSTLMCAPFSGPAAWSCAVAMGLLGMMPNFNDACD